MPADTSHGCVHEDDARWVGGPLTSIAVLSAPSEGSFSTSGHRAAATSIIGQMKRYPELPALPTPITPGWGTRSFHILLYLLDQPNPRLPSLAAARGRSDPSHGPLARGQLAESSPVGCIGTPAAPANRVRLVDPERAGPSSQTGHYAWESLGLLIKCRFLGNCDFGRKYAYLGSLGTRFRVVGSCSELKPGLGLE